MPGRPPLIRPIAAPRARQSGIAAAASVAVAVLAGCAAGPVALAPPTPQEPVASACRAFDASLPDTLSAPPEGAELSERRTDPESPFTAAWGDPAITVSCGVPRPAERQGDAQLFEIDGVTWFAQPLTRGTRFTSEDRIANLQVDVPDDYRPEAQVLVDLAPLIDRAVPLKPAASDA